MYFYVPDYLIQDFDDSLSINGKQCIINSNSATPVIMNINTNDLKSNVRNIGDGSFIIEYSKNIAIPLKKGDLIYTNNSYYLVVWKPMETINCLNSKIQLCTKNIEFQRFHAVTFDSLGNSTTPTYYEAIASDVKCFMFRNGMTVFSANESDIGIVPTQKIGVSCQYNLETSLIKITDEFTLNNNRYIITDIDYSQMNEFENDGILVMYAQIVQGGLKT